MKRSTKRLISLLICLAMALAILPVAAFAAGTTKVYCQAPTGWTNCNAYWWGSSADNPGWPGNAMEQDANGIWYYEVPSDATGLIFNNGSGTQTSDLTVPTDDKTMYVFSNRVWELPGGPVIEVVEYFVAGSAGLCGVEWNPSAAENKLTKVDDIYTITYTNILAGSYEFKVTNGTWDLAWGQDADSTGGAPNVVVDLTEPTNTVQILFDPVAPSLEVVINAPEPEPDPDPVPGDETVIAEATVNFETAEAAWAADIHEFIPAADGNVTIDVTACNPGFYVDVYADGEWIDEYYETDPKAIVIPVSAGVTYEFIVCSAEIYFPGMGSPAAGSVTYKITADVAAGEPNPGGGGDIGSGAGTSEMDPLYITSFYGIYLEAGQTVWLCYDNYEHMMIDGVYSQMLHISAGVPYGVTYRGIDVPVDAEGFVAYEMMDMMYSGKYVFSVTNNGTSKAFFSIEVKDRPEYVISEYALALGDNVVIPDPEFAKTLYEFTPEGTGVYTFTISNGLIGNWGSYFNPVDNTGTKDTVLQWTCSAEGQSVMIGVAETEEAILTVERTGDYIADEEIEATVYENTYGFTYQLPENPELVPIDVLDDKADVAVLDDDGFYRYGSANGPLMVADLNEFPINLADAYINWQLRAYIRDKDGKVTAKYDYNEAMNEYLEAGLVPVTEELAMMLKQVGDHHGWWLAGGFVFEEDAPEDVDTAWMVACSYIKGSELAGDNNGGNNGGNNSGNSSGNNSGSSNSGNSNPKTTDISMAWAFITMVVAGTCLVVLKKKEAFFVK